MIKLKVFYDLTFPLMNTRTLTQFFSKLTFELFGGWINFKTYQGLTQAVDEHSLLVLPTFLRISKY